MRRKSSRGSALITAMIVLFVVFVTGSGLMALSIQSLTRGRLDVLRAQALTLADAGAEKALHYLRTTAPDGSTNGTWRTDADGLTETVDAFSRYTMTVTDGTGDNDGKIVITSVGRARDGAGAQMTRATRVAVKVSREDVSIWNTAIFGGVGQAGKSINGNVQINGSVHLLGDGEEFTDVDRDTRVDAGEAFSDSNRNGQYDPGEPYTDTDGDGRYDRREAFNDVNGNGTRDPALTVTDLATEIGGNAAIGNNYAEMPSDLRNLLPSPPTTDYKGETVETLSAKLRAKHGRVNISGSATAGDPQVLGGSPMRKETLDGAYVSDGFGGNAGSSQVYSDNGSNVDYDLGDGVVRFPTLTEQTVKGGTTYPSYMDYLRSTGLVVNGPLTLQGDDDFGPISDGQGNSLEIDDDGNMTVHGIVYVNGDINFARGDSIRYSGRGSLVSTGSIYVHTNILPSNGTFPVTHTIGFIARRRIELATGGGDSHLKLSGAFYAQEQIISEKQNELAGTFVTSHFSMQNVPHMYQVPSLPDNLPPGMPGDAHIWVKTIRIDSWREVRAT